MHDQHREHLITLLQHYESHELLRLRLSQALGRDQEIRAIRRLVAERMATGGYVIITAGPGEGKSSVIARMVQQDGAADTAFHVIALKTAPDYKLTLLQTLAARLVLKHDLPGDYFPLTSYPALRDYFVTVLQAVASRGGGEVIYIDGLDQLQPEPDGMRDLSFLPLDLPPGIVIVLGTRPNERLQPLALVAPTSEYRLPPLSLEDFGALLRRHAVTLWAAQIAKLHRALAGNALALGLAAQALSPQSGQARDELLRTITARPAGLLAGR
jgi:hypothetical protein